MQKNNFCIISNKSLKACEAGNAPSYFVIFKKKEKEENQINKKLEERIIRIYKKRKNQCTREKIIRKMYFLSKNILMKYNGDYNSMIINNIIINKTSHFYSVYKDIFMFYNSKTDYIKKYYTYSESIKIIPRRQAYFKHLMIYIEYPKYKNFIYNKLLKTKNLEKLIFYKKTNYPKKFNKKENLNLDNNNLPENNIIFNSDVIETIENCSTSLTQCSNKKNNNINNNIIQSQDLDKKNENVSIISEIKSNKAQNRRSDSNVSCIDNSLLIVMKDLSISPNIINKYLYMHNNNYKKLYNRMKSKSKTITMKNRNDKEKQIIEKENKNNIIQKKFLEKQPNFTKENENNFMIKINKGNKRIHDSNSLIKKLNNIKIMQLNSNSIKSSSQIDSQTINSLNSFNKYRLSFGNKIHEIHSNKRKNNKKFSCREINQIQSNYFNKNNTRKKKENNIGNFFDKNNNQSNINNKVILKSIKKIIQNQRPKNNSLRKYINIQKFMTDSANCFPDMNSLNEIESKRMIQTINPVRSISISNNQFFKCIKRFGTDINNEK